MSRWRFDGFAHGADYYPEQWLGMPEVLREDIRLMKKANISVVTLGVFAWAALEPAEGQYRFEWLDEVIARLWENGIAFILATPSGARPAWLAEKYPEVLRTAPDGRRNFAGMRMNHCYTAPEYRRLVGNIDRRLAARYAEHPGLVGWHISNEYHGECHCELCQAAFREFLQRKYGTLEALNAAWWAAFWAKTYTGWQQIRGPSPCGERAVQGLALDWLRFVTWQTGAFMRLEIEAVREHEKRAPVTTNMIGSFIEIDYPRLAPMLDISGIDIYPDWGVAPDAEIAMAAGFEYDVIRGLKRQPFLLMETTPSVTNWAEVGRGKRPGLHKAACLQAVAHGAESVMYFQWRQSRGAYEKFHGAVVAHSGHADTRVFREVAEVGTLLERLAPVAGSGVKAEVALLYDWNNRWAIGGSKGPRADMEHEQVVREHYAALRGHGVNVDVIDEQQEFEGYRLIVAPMLYMLKPGVAQRLEQFVQAGGVFVATAFSGVVDENDLCFLGGFPGPLRRLLGIWCEELDTLGPGDSNAICVREGGPLAAGGEHECGFFCEVVHTEGAAVAAVFGHDYYAGGPAVTCNTFGIGEAWYVATRPSAGFLRELYGALLGRAGVRPLLEEVPEGLCVTERVSGQGRYLFLVNFAAEAVVATVPRGREMLRGEMVEGRICIERYGARVILVEE